MSIRISMETMSIIANKDYDTAVTRVYESLKDLYTSKVARAMAMRLVNTIKKEVNA